MITVKKVESILIEIDGITAIISEDDARQLVQQLGALIKRETDVNVRLKSKILRENIEILFRSGGEYTISQIVDHAGGTRFACRWIVQNLLVEGFISKQRRGREIFYTLEKGV